MSRRKGMFAAVRAAAVALTIGGAALMGHSGIDSARAATTPDSPAGSPVLAAPAVTSTDCDKDKSDDKAKPDVVDQAMPAEKDDDKDKDKDKKDDDKDRKDDETCTTTTTTTTTSSVGSVAVPLPAPPATGVKAASAPAPVTAIPKTGSEVPFVAGLLLTTAGAGALILGRRRRRSQ